MTDTISCSECGRTLPADDPSVEEWEVHGSALLCEECLDRRLIDAEKRHQEELVARYDVLLQEVREAVGPAHQPVVDELDQVLTARVRAAWDVALSLDAAVDAAAAAIEAHENELAASGPDEDLDEDDRVELLERRVDRIEEIIAQVATVAAGIERRHLS